MLNPQTFSFSTLRHLQHQQEEN